MKVKTPYSLLIIVLFFNIIGSHAQISQGGLPYSFKKQTINNEIPFVTMPKVDHRALIKEEIPDKRGGFKFGKEFEVDLHLFNAGQWITLVNGDRIWQLGIHSENAYSLNLIFDNFYLPPQATFYIYTLDKSYVLGAFTDKNNIPEKVFSTTLLPGSDVVLEYYEPKEVYQQGIIHLSTVVHGYKDFFFKSGPYGSSGPCHINVNCQEGDKYKDVSRAVALILNGSYAHCTGTLINNTKNDGTPYFLTAQHCITGKDLSRFVFVFGYQTANCNGTEGSMGASIQAATLIADGDYSDFALLRLSSAPPINYNPYYVGWNKKEEAASSSACIHHPSGDYKKISLCNTPVVSSSYDDYPTDTHWEVSSWTKGSTEGGSSGAPLFNQNYLLVGQLEGGTATCFNLTGYDVFGKLSYSWLNNNSTLSNKRLKDWLDPLNLGVNTWNGYDPCLPSYEVDAFLKNIDNPTHPLCHYYIIPKITISNNGSTALQTLSIHYTLNGSNMVNYEWSGNIAFGETAYLELPEIDVSGGDYHLRVWTDRPNQTQDQNTSNDTLHFDFSYQKGFPVSWDIKTDLFPEETSWFIKDIEGNIIAQNPANLSLLTKYKSTFCLDTGCYDFVIYDSQGNGLSGTDNYGKGYYYFSVNDKIVLSGIQFEYKDSIRFCLDETTGIASFTKNSPREHIQICLNPADHYITVCADNLMMEAQYKVSIYALDGRKIMELPLIEGENILEFPAMSSGLYVVKIQSKHYLTTHKILIQK